MSARRQRAALVGAVTGAVLAGTAAGLAAERRAVRAPRTRPDPTASLGLGDLRPDRTHAVVADDGVPLHVQEIGPADADVTIVLVHGFCLDSGSWHLQLPALSSMGRVVAYDHRSHGRSGRSHTDACTIDQLGADLERVIDECAPTGPVVLVGHSMGGMTLLALAARRPEWFGPRVVGVGLLSTSAGRMAEVTFGVPALIGRVVAAVRPKLWVGLSRRAALLERGRRHGTDLGHALVRRFAFGTDADVPPGIVDFVERMVGATPLDVISAFAPGFLDHDKLGAAAVLAGLPTLVLVGTDDLVTPVDHSRELAAALGPETRLVEVAGAGHMVTLERAPTVNLHLRQLVGRALQAHSKR